MRVVVALDSFKGSLDSRAAGEAVAAGVRAADAHASVRIVLAELSATTCELVRLLAAFKSLSDPR